MNHREQRNFAKRGRPRKDVSDTEEAEGEEVEAAETVEAAEPEPVEEAPVEEELMPEPEPTSAPQEPLDIDAALFDAFKVDVKRIDSTPDHKPPRIEDTIEGRFAAVLFTAASTENALFDVYEDMIYLGHLYKNCEAFELFTRNAGIGNKEIGMFNDALRSLGDFHDVTYKFIEVTCECKRFMYLNDISKKYL